MAGMFCCGATVLARPRSGCLASLTRLPPSSLRKERQLGRESGQRPLRLAAAETLRSPLEAFCVRCAPPSDGPRPRPFGPKASLQQSYTCLDMHHAHGYYCFSISCRVCSVICEYITRMPPRSLLGVCIGVYGVFVGFCLWLVLRRSLRRSVAGSFAPKALPAPMPDF